MAEQRVSLPSDQIYNLSSFEYHLTRILESGKSRVCLFLSGKTGVGKSHLTNALIGKEVAEEGDSLDPMSQDPTPYETEMNGVRIIVWDTPGMADGSQREQAYLMSMMNKIKDVDLFLYCAEMNTQRVRNDDIKCIQDLTKAFGHRLWNNALIVLTFANEVHPAKGKKISNEEYFIERLRMFKKKYYRVLEEAGIPELIVHRVPVVPVGELGEPKLPDRENWITALWIQAFKRMAEEAQPAMLLANIHRIELVDPVSVEGEKPLDGSSAVLDEFFSPSAGLRRQNSSGVQVELTPEEKRRIREARRSFQSLEGSPTPNGGSSGNGGGKRWSFGCDRERDSTNFTTRDKDSGESGKTSVGDPFDPESDSLAGSEAQEHKKTSSDENTGVQQNTEGTVPLQMYQQSMWEVIGEVSKELRQDGKEYAEAGELIFSWFDPNWGQKVGKIGGYALGAIIKLIRKICEMIGRKNKNTVQVKI